MFDEIIKEAARQSMQEREEETLSETQLEARIQDLKDISSRYQKGCPFKVGDLITPRKGYNKVGHGKPEVVLEVRSEPIFNTQITDDMRDVGTTFFGSRLDMRVAAVQEGTFCAFWVESWQYESFPQD